MACSPSTVREHSMGHDDEVDVAVLVGVADRERAL